MGEPVQIVFCVTVSSVISIGWTCSSVSVTSSSDVLVSTDSTSTSLVTSSCVVSITVERFLAVTKPHYRLVSNVKRSVCYIVPCVLLAILLNFSKFFETETVTFCLDFTACGCGYHSRMYVRPTQLRLSQVEETNETFVRHQF